MHKLAGAVDFEDLVDPFTCPLDEVEAYLAAGIQDPYTRGLTVGIYLARCAERAPRPMQRVASPASQLN